MKGFIGKNTWASVTITVGYSIWTFGADLPRSTLISSCHAILEPTYKGDSSTVDMLYSSTFYIDSFVVSVNMLVITQGI